MPHDTDLAYFAGAIDADGFVTIQRAVKRSAPATPTYYTAAVGLGGAGAEPIVQLRLQAAFGGSVYRRAPRRETQQPWHVWSAGGPMAAAALRALAPFLVTKREQARLAVALVDLQAEQWRAITATQVPPYRVPDAMQAAREQLWREVTALNAPRNRRVHFVPAT